MVAQRCTQAGGDALAAALNRLAAAAEDEARVQSQIACAARAAAQAAAANSQHESRADVLGSGIRDVLDLVAASSDRMVGAAGQLRRTWAAKLAAQGLGLREIAARLGVSRQRVSVVLARAAADPLSPH